MNRLRVVRSGAVYRTAWLVLGAGILAVAVAIPATSPPFRVLQFTLAIVWAISAMGLNLLTGYGGQINVAQSAFFAVGAYTAAILMTTHGWAYWTTIPVAAAIAFVIGLVVGIPALRLQGMYLAMLTLAVGLIAPPLIKRYETVTGGSAGMLVTKPSAPSWSGLADDQWRYVFTLTIATALFLVMRNLVKSRAGRGVIALRDNEIVAGAMGVHPTQTKVLTFAVCAAFGGVAGALYAVSVGIVTPESFTILLSINFLTAVVIGGKATLFGPVIGGLFIEFVPVYVGEVNDALIGVTYGVVLIIVMILMPSGVVGILTKARNRFVTLVSQAERPQRATAGSDSRTPAGDATNSPAGAHRTVPDTAVSFAATVVPADRGEGRP